MALASICGFPQISMESWLNITQTDTMCYLQEQILISCMFAARKAFRLSFWKLDGTLKSTYFFWGFKIYSTNSNFRCLIKGKIKTNKKNPIPKYEVRRVIYFYLLQLEDKVRNARKKKKSQFLWFLLLIKYSLRQKKSINLNGLQTFTT